MVNGKYTFKEPTKLQKLQIRRQFEKFDLGSIGKHIIMTDLALPIMEYCYGVNEDEFVKLNESIITEHCGEAITKLFFEDAQQKKS